MTKRTKVLDTTNMTAAELREAGVPYLVAPNDLKMLGLDPEEYLRSRGTAAGWMLDRVEHADIIYRLSTMHTEHGVPQ